MKAAEESLRIQVGEGSVSAIWNEAPGASARTALAPGAGAPLTSPFMVGFARAIADLGVAVLRFNFPYQERLPRPPDRPSVLLAAWRAAFQEALNRAEGRPVSAGGKSLGGRIASMAASEGMPAAALVFLGYPLHPPGRPERMRDAHLYDMEVPMLFLQGSRDPFATPELLRRVVDRIGDRARLVEIPDGDHSFHRRGTPRDPGADGASLAAHVAEFLSGAAVGR